MSGFKEWFIGTFDVDKNGKVRLADAEAKFGAAVVRAFLIGGGVFSIIGFFAGRLTK